MTGYYACYTPMFFTRCFHDFLTSRDSGLFLLLFHSPGALSARIDLFPALFTLFVSFSWDMYSEKDFEIVPSSAQ